MREWAIAVGGETYNSAKSIADGEFAVKCSVVCVVGVWVALSSAAWGANKPSKDELDAVTAQGRFAGRV